MDLTTRLGTEIIQREAIVILYNDLNDKIASMNQIWEEEDDNFWSQLNRGNEDWFVEKIDDKNFYAGIIPSLINSSIENYPNVSTICYMATPTVSEDDNAEIYQNVLAVEVMVKSINSEQEVNSRIQKTLDAIHLVFMDSLDNRTLNNTVSPLGAPKLTIGDVFVRREKTVRGDRWYWQGGALEYTVNKFVVFP